MAGFDRVSQIIIDSASSGPARQRRPRGTIRTATGTFTPTGGGFSRGGPMIHPMGPVSATPFGGRGTQFAPGTLGTLGGTLGDRIGGSTGGAIGEALGTIAEGLIGGRRGTGTGSKPGEAPSTQGSGLTGGGTCPTGTIRGPLGTCIDLVPGGSTSGHGVLVPQVPAGAAGGFGFLGAVAPGVHAQPRFTCPTGFVLGIDNMCYHKKVLPRQFRKWKPAPRPVLSAADAKTIRRADTLRKKVKRVAKRSGLKVAR